MKLGNEWHDLTEPWERLRWARERWQGDAVGSASDAAESMGMKPGTYRAYERPPEASKHTPLDDQHAIKFGKKFGVRWTWLLTGEGTPFEDHSSEIERVMRAMERMPGDVQKTLADMAEGLAVQRKRRTGTKG